MTQATPTFNEGAVGPVAPSKRAFARHFAEMVLAMFIGMGVFAGLAELALSASGSSFSALPGELRILLMGLSMTVPMTAWMAYRGHAGARNAEMAASMMTPTVLVAGLVWGGTLGIESGLGVQHAIMVPAMLGVMLWRYADYAGTRA
jgi:hypothetical protein